MKLTREIIGFLTNHRNLTALLRGTCGAKDTVKATSLRVKPDVSVIFSWADEQTQAQGWGRVLWSISYSKAKQVVALSAQQLSVAKLLGLSYQIYTLPLIGFQIDGEPLLIQWGSYASDPVLAKQFADYIENQPAESLADFKVLRYNPLRRILISFNNQVVRLAKTTKPAEFFTLWEDFAASSLPVVPLLTANPTAPVSKLLRGKDGEKYLQTANTQQTEAFHRHAGKLFAQLHQIKPDFSLPAKAGLADLLQQATPKTLSQVDAHRRILGELAARGSALENVLETELPKLITKIRPLVGPERLAHGDASADQLIVVAKFGGNEMYLNDFDRVCLAPTVLDLGSYLQIHAVTAQTETAFLNGYQEAGGSLPSGTNLQMAKLHAALQRLANPLRRAQADWEHQINTQIHRLNKEYIHGNSA
ncbi:MAG: phosphotransferase [Actinomycetaceae bacterium]|nr:phosphotransferase [Actinomycetaceae bacterium]